MVLQHRKFDTVATIRAEGSPMSSWKDKLALIAQRNRQEIVKAKLDRREMMRLGLLTAGGTLVHKAGSSHRAYAAAADAGTPTARDSTLGGSPPSPPVTPWVQPMPRLPLKTTVDYKSMRGGPPAPTTPIAGATNRIGHQYFS